MQRAGREDLMRTRRRRHERITVNGVPIVIRDQAPLHAGNARFPRHYSFEDFVESLNSKIFFWPGKAARPIPYGVRHFQHYKRENPVLLRMRFDSLLQQNPAATPLFCRYNSGSPRWSNGTQPPRGPNTFLPAGNFTDTPSGVVEVTFDSQLVLPADTEFSPRLGGPWKLLR